ncbi:probable WRKY transcription factor 20 [Mangifera indica]|uniref:probable WRKY transcription factor 20 n=1 Tax=Mangifera indica TaxID=29780 RepID=UPI001CF9AFFD|nr:probable WRKY transcription factor 20 [Mangifera indica]
MEATEVGVGGCDDVLDTADPPRVGSTVDTASASVGARYKLMSPAKLPISRSPCITIPPGLSPTSFLESPVLLSNVKAEPSPTTGSLFKPQSVHATAGSGTYLATTVCLNKSNEGQSNCFEFRPTSRSNMVPADLNCQRSEQHMQTQGQCQNLPLASPTIKSEMAVLSNELNLSAPLQMGTSGATVPLEVDADDLKQIGNPSSMIQPLHADYKGSGSSVPADDGFNWRKYGQKHVKGSEFPRSYYKCTHPNCEVKKLFERSHDGQITEIIYKGTHDHPKPQPSRRYSAGTIMSIQDERSDKLSSLTRRDDKSPSMPGQMSHTMETNGLSDLSPAAANDDGAEEAEGDDDDPFSKRRKLDTMMADVTPVVKPIREPRVVVQTVSEVDILDDGYRWRKYGQKVVRGNPNPRSYYKCTNAGCPVRKHVERASHDPKAVITTYEGKHNHVVPTARTSSHDTAGPPAGAGPSRIVAEESDTISLDLGVGISSAAENRSNEQSQALHSQLAQVQPHASSSNFKIIQATPVTTYYGVLNGGMDQYGSRENPIDRRRINIPPLNHSSYPYPQNIGRILMGP